MSTGLLDPYSACPVHDMPNFTLRLVQPEDAADLLHCYSDPSAIPLFNSDNCLYGFHMHTLEEMNDCIAAWLEEYRLRRYVRFSIVLRTSGRAVGTLEFFTRPGPAAGGPGETGIVRLDLSSSYEQEALLNEILELLETKFGSHFAFDSLLTKAVPQAAARISVLRNLGYHKVEASAIIPYDDYYLKEFSQ